MKLLIRVSQLTVLYCHVFTFIVDKEEILWGYSWVCLFYVHFFSSSYGKLIASFSYSSMLLFPVVVGGQFQSAHNITLESRQKEGALVWGDV